VRRTLWLAALLCALCVGAGCASESHRRSLRDDPDSPSCLEEARFLEDRAIAKILEGNDHATLPGTRQRYYDHALADLEDAQLLLETELLEEPGSAEKQQFLDGEIRRIAARVAHLHRIRPIE